MRTIKELSREVYYNMGNYSQLVIDYVQDFEDLLNDENKTSEEFGAFSYQIGNVKEIIDPTRLHDISVLEDLLLLIKEKTQSLNTEVKSTKDFPEILDVSNFNKMLKY